MQKATVIAPTYNNERTLISVLRGVRNLDLPLIVVNDGSTDRTGRLLAAWKKRHAETIVLAHDRNLGKAAAMTTGFQAAIERGYTHAVTIDTDGQLSPADIPEMLAAARDAPKALVIGVRSTSIPGYPSRNMLGRRFSSLFILIECGVKLRDSQCGLRVYPLDLIAELPCRAKRYAFETEVIVRSAWAGMPVREHPIHAEYFEGARHVSHYKPFIDTLRAAVLHVRLILRALVPWPHRRLVRNSASRLNWRELVRWIDPRRAWHDIRGSHERRGAIAFGLAVGAFIANTPFYGLHTVMSLYVARRLCVHPLSVVLGSHLSTPPIGPILIGLAILIGHLLRHGEMPNRSGKVAGALPSIVGVPLDLAISWSIGSLIVGTACLVLTFFGALILLNWRLKGESADAA